MDEDLSRPTEQVVNMSVAPGERAFRRQMKDLIPCRRISSGGKDARGDKGSHSKPSCRRCCECRGIR